MVMYLWERWHTKGKRADRRCEKERECVCVCVSEWVSEWVSERECVSEWERERECEWESKKERERVWKWERRSKKCQSKVPGDLRLDWKFFFQRNQRSSFKNKIATYKLRKSKFSTSAVWSKYSFQVSWPLYYFDTITPSKKIRSQIT